MRWTAAGTSSREGRSVVIEVFAGRRAIVYARSVRRPRSSAGVGIRTVDVRSDGDRITGRVVEKSRMTRTDGASVEHVAEKPARRAESRNDVQAEKSDCQLVDM
jgi:hypothetical protein